MGSQVVVIPSQQGTVTVAPIHTDSVEVVTKGTACYETFPWVSLYEVAPTPPSHRLYAESDYIIDVVRATVTTPADSDIVVDLLSNGASIASLSIPAGEYTGYVSPEVPLERGDYLQIQVLQAGNAEPGQGLTVAVRLRVND